MIPNTICIFGICLPLYGIFVTLGLLAYTICTMLILEKRERFSKKLTIKILLLSIPCVLVLYISAFIFNSIFHSIEQGKIVIGGITWLGGVLGMLPFTFFIFHKFVPEARGKEITFISLLTPGIVLGHAFGRVGCFFGGCCFGMVTHLPIGVIYPEGSLAASLHPGLNGASLPVLPTQLFEAAFELILFFVLIFKPKKFHRYDIEYYGILYSIFRFILEFFRADDRGGTGFFLSPSQLMSILLLTASILALLMEYNVIFKKINAKLEYWRNNPIQKPKENSGANFKEALLDLKELFDKGIITEEEYENKKKDILDNIVVNSEKNEI